MCMRVLNRDVGNDLESGLVPLSSAPPQSYLHGYRLFGMASGICRCCLHMREPLGKSRLHSQETARPTLAPELQCSSGPAQFFQSMLIEVRRRINTILSSSRRAARLPNSRCQSLPEAQSDVFRGNCIVPSPSRPAARRLAYNMKPQHQIQPN